MATKRYKYKSRANLRHFDSCSPGNSGRAEHVERTRILTFNFEALQWSDSGYAVCTTHRPFKSPGDRSPARI